MKTVVRPIRELVAAMVPRRRDHTVTIVGIDGCGGAGKTTLAASLAEACGASVVHTDDFYKPSHERPSTLSVGDAYDWIRLRDQVLTPLASGLPARYQLYDWRANALTKWCAVEASGIVIVEGVYSTRLELRDLYDVRIWVEARREVRLARGLARDGELARDRWTNEWMPQEDLYVSTHSPTAQADVLVSGCSEDVTNLKAEYVEIVAGA